MYLSLTDIAAISPLLIVLVAALLLLLLESFAERAAKTFSVYLALAALIGAVFATFYAPISENPLLTPWLRFDSLTRLFTIFFLVIGCATSLLSSSFFQRFQATHGEYFFLRAWIRH